AGPPGAGKSTISGRLHELLPEGSAEVVPMDGFHYDDIILNRRGFEERATLLLDQCGKAGFPVALVLADLDHFKALNDRHGHEAGDRVIADFAAKLRSA
ncbi:diguanylate cyclase, partial [bacterium M00.F.Ca.ET.168.01.1.1]